MPDQPLSPEERTRQLARSLSADDPVGWFEQLYVAADRGEALVPWDRGGPNPMLISWAEREPAAPPAPARWWWEAGSATTPSTCPSWATPRPPSMSRRRPCAQPSSATRGSLVDYRVASLLDPPPELPSGFDLVLESLTVQALPEALRSQAIARWGGSWRRADGCW